MDGYGSLNPVLEITVHGCSKLKNMSFFTKQHPYVWLDYVGMEFRTTTHKEGGNNPTYNQKYYFRLIEDVDQLDVHVYSKNSVATDTFIGSGRVYLQRVLSVGYDETAWPIVDKHKKFAGEVKLSMAILQSEANLIAGKNYKNCT
ncbi:elicitor-responsive protein 3 isoform X2 [Cryptomeria japonica]|uniref:elicitor-responsive protein 3 isoform X2 n=1 Tax=Cryptomeria japonica TaxID=3369 RepID=UPI0027DA08EB|nr:elicitor-responsive protein 3 isoform X2 [Cryptomeria japonica]